MKVKRLFALMLALVVCVILVSGSALAYKGPGTDIGPPEGVGPGADAMGRTSEITVTVVYEDETTPAAGALVNLFRYEDGVEELVGSGTTLATGVCVIPGVHGFGEVVAVATLDVHPGSELEGTADIMMRGYITVYSATVVLHGPPNMPE